MFFNRKNFASSVSDNPCRFFASSRLKSGVSLITVLLLMLVATIAATATYKLLSSMGFTSESRMRVQEAHQSSLAGIENARMWMTFHANDVGALMKAFIDGGNKPINLDARLRPLQRAGQNYHVWLTGVNTEKSTTKLKILSSGESKNDTRWNEVAIFNVDGLYRVRLFEEEVYSAIPFKYNYFGGTTKTAGHLKAFSMLINGNLESESNPVYTDDDLVVTGNVKMSGNSVGAGGTVCVGGNLDANNGVLGNDFYIGGNANAFTFPSSNDAAHLTNANVTGNVYIEGNLNAPTTGDQKFQKNLTLNGIWKTKLEAHDSRVAGNLCLGPDAQVQLDKKRPPRTFLVGENVWSEPLYPIAVPNNEDNQDAYDRIVLGNKAESKVFIRSAHPIADYVTLRNDRTFIEKNTYYRGTSGGAWGFGPQSRWDNKTTRPYPELKHHIKSKDDAYYFYYYNGPGQDVDFIVTSGGGLGPQSYYASYYVANEPFYSNNKNHYLNYENSKPTGSPYCKAGPDRWRPECNVSPWFKSLGTVSRDLSAGRNFECAESVKAHCDSIWEKKDGCDHSKYKVDDILVTAYSKFVTYANKGCTDVKYWGNTMSDRLNECYRKNSSNPELAKTNLYNGYQVVKVAEPGQKKDPKTPLKGKFIIIVTNALGQQSLPPTTSDSYVLLYLEKGQTGESLVPADNSGSYNYFIYTKDNINQILFNEAVFSGSVYATAESCSKVRKFQSRSMTFNEDLMNDLSANAVICAATVSESSCGNIIPTSSSGGEATSASGSASAQFDSYYISMAPQLGVRLESQNKTSESLPQAGDENTTVLSPSFIVLPRIIYLPNDPYGALIDYYNVQQLNASAGVAALKKSDVAVACTGPGTMPTSGSLYLSGSPLSKGLYTCTASATGYSDIPFWVHVGDDTRSTPQISFESNSFKMGPDDIKEVKLVVPAHASPVTVEIYCPDEENEAWSYVNSLDASVTREGTTCKLLLPASDAESTPTLAMVRTLNAVEGSLIFQLLPGEGYIPGTPSSTELYLTSSAQLNREEATSSEIETYCTSHSGDCPANYKTYWPDCEVSGVWVEPTGTPFINKVDNSTWVIMAGNTQAVTLTPAAGNENDCVIIIPETGNSIAANGVKANESYMLRASAKAPMRSFRVGFKGNVGANNHPVINVSISSNSGDRSEVCRYDDAVMDSETSGKMCSVSVFKGDMVTVALEDDSNAEEFSFWKCTGTSCPTTDETVTSKTYNSFTLSESGTDLIAVFGEADKHCFFDEFKNSSVECGTETKYCIDKCGNDATSVCAGAVDASGLYTEAKWHLVSGVHSQILTGDGGEIHIDKSVIKKKKQSAREPVVVMSTVNAGIVGTLKALINVPRATSSYDNSAVNIKNSGFMLRANTYGNDYFMLNLYENRDGKLEAQLWKGSTSLSFVLTNENGNSATVSNSKMVMVTASVTATNVIEVRAYVGNYYGGSPREYGCSFNLADFNNTLADAAHEFVGFSLADPNFKIYGIGWKSGTYNSECHDTYPTVKCSFAAVATDGVIKTDELVKPWVGHSGWFDSKDCTPVYYYYNGDDASSSCGFLNESGATCSNGYQFDKSGAGAHGYTEGDTEYKTAKAWLANCLNTDNSDVIWLASAESERAHCGAFWTGEFTECTDHQDLFSGSRSVGYGLDESITFDNKQNLRAATLHITLENTDYNEVEIWLVSESENWGSVDHESHSVKMNGNSGSFDVMQEFATGSSGFDPEHVKMIVLKNHGTTSVTVTSVTSSCANAVGITYCRAEYDGNNWNVTTQVTNKSLISSQRVTATVEGGTGLNVTKAATGDDGIVWNGDISLLSIPDANVYNYQGKSYVFNATITGTSGQTASKQCTVSPDPIGKIGVNCSVVGSIASGARYPTFNIDFNGCPGEGCAYEVYLDYGKSGSTKVAEGVQKTSARHSAAGQSETCNVTEGCEHTYTVKSTATPALFEDCIGTFKVMRNAEDVPPTVTCGVSTNQYGFTADPISVSDNVYFLARNDESVEKTFNVTLKKEGANVGSSTLKNWSQITNVASLGTLQKGNHTYSLFVDDEKVCDVNVSVTEESGACSISGNLYEGQLLSMNVSGVKANTQFTWALGNDSKTIDCGTGGCWNNTMNAPIAAGTYSYSVRRGASTICSGNLTISPILTCSVTPNSVNQGENYTFQANRAAGVNCWSCSYNYDAGTQQNVNTGTPIVKTASSSGTKTLSFSCTCDNNFSASCSTPLEIIKPKPTFSCPADLKASTVGSNNVTIIPQNLEGCDEGGSYCYYTIAGTGVTGDSYTGGALPSFTESGKDDGDSETYAVALTNSAGTTTENCSVEFTSAPVCGCTCSSGCDNLGTHGVEGTTDAVRCIFATSITEINENYGRNTIWVNGKRPGYCNGQSSCNTALADAGITTVDGGYYIEVPRTRGCYDSNPPNGVNADCQWIKVSITGGTPACGGATSSSSEATLPSSSASSPTSSDTPTSSGSVTEMVITNGQYPPQVNNVTSGTCFSLSGVWNNDCNRHPQLNCNVTSGGGGVRITYGSNQWETSNYNLKQDLGVAMPCSPNPAVFIDRVCVEWINGTEGWCKFEN